MRALENDARTAWRGGDQPRAIELWSKVAVLDPNHAEAANMLGMWNLARGQSAEAERHLKRAVAADPGQPALLFNYAAAARGAGNPQAALDALQEALSVDPYFVQAIFQKAVLLEETGNVEAAALIYQDFLDTAAPEILDDPRFQPALNRARAVLAASNAGLERRIEEAAAATALPLRALEAVGALLGKHRVFVAEPTFFTVPRLPAIPFFDRELTPWIAELEAATPLLIKEASRVIAEDADGDFVPYVANPPGTPVNQWKELDHSPQWGAYFFWKHGVFDGENARRCPHVSDLLARMPLIALHGRGPNAFFSLLRPHARIPPHTGVSNIRSTVHLPLIVPPGCGFRVGAETREWRPGEAWVFDDTIEHEAWNESDYPRLILIFDVWNPLLTEEEQAYYAAVLQAYDSHYKRPKGLSATL